MTVNCREFARLLSKFFSTPFGFVEQVLCELG